jgi:phage major head subunit gpT-like protein
LIINSQNLDALRVGFQTAFQGGLGIASSQHARVATEVTSSRGEERYGWLGKIPGVREWLGDRVVQNLSTSDYAIRNKDWELTIAVDRNDIEDDNLGVYNPLFQEMGQSTGAHFDQLIYGLLKAGFATLCYDGQYFFDTDHPVLDEAGARVSVANTDGGAGTPWFLLCTKRVIKPLVLQKRKDWQFVALDNSRDPNVFTKKQFVYGADARCSAGYGLWQYAWGSKQPLNAANYEIARAALTGMKGDYGRPLGLMPDLLVVPPSLEGAGRGLLQSQLVNGGESNKWAGTAELLVSPWLA